MELRVDVRVDYSQGFARYLSGRNLGHRSRILTDLESEDPDKVFGALREIQTYEPSVRVIRHKLGDYGRVKGTVSATPTIRFLVYLAPEEEKIRKREDVPVLL